MFDTQLSGQKDDFDTQLSGQETEFNDAKDKWNDTFNSQFIYKNGGEWADAPAQITDADKLTYWTVANGDGYAVKGSVTLPIAKPVTPVNDDNWFIANAVNVTKMRTDSASQLGLVYFADWSTGMVIPGGAMTAKVAVWHDGQFYSIGTDAGFTSNDFAEDLGKGWFVSAGLLTGTDYLFKSNDAREIGIKFDGSDQTVLLNILAKPGKTIRFFNNDFKFNNETTSDYMSESVSVMFTDTISFAPHTKFIVDESVQFFNNISGNKPAFDLFYDNQIIGGNVLIGKDFRGLLYDVTDRDGAVIGAGKYGIQQRKVKVSSVTTQSQQLTDGDTNSQNFLWDFCRVYSDRVGFWDVEFSDVTIGRGVGYLIIQDTTNNGGWLTGNTFKNILCGGSNGGIYNVGRKANESLFENIVTQGANFTGAVQHRMPMLYNKGFVNKFINFKCFDPIHFYNDKTDFGSNPPYLVFCDDSISSTAESNLIQNLSLSEDYFYRGKYLNLINIAARTRQIGFTFAGQTLNSDAKLKLDVRLVPLVGRISTGKAGVYWKLGEFKNIPKKEQAGTWKMYTTFEDVPEYNTGVTQRFILSYLKNKTGQDGTLSVKCYRIDNNINPESSMRYNDGNSKLQFGSVQTVDASGNLTFEIWCKMETDYDTWIENYFSRVLGASLTFVSAINSDDSLTVLPESSSTIYATKYTEVEPVGYVKAINVAVNQ